MKSLYSIALDAQAFIENYTKQVLQPKYECFVLKPTYPQHNISKIYYRAENVAITLERTNGELITTDDLSIGQIFALAMALDCCEYDISNPTIN